MALSLAISAMSSNRHHESSVNIGTTATEISVRLFYSAHTLVAFR